MWKHSWFQWLIVQASLLGVGAAVWAVLAWRRLDAAAEATLWAVAALASAWCYYGLWRRRRNVGSKRLAIYLAVSNGVWLYAALTWQSYPHWAKAALGAWLISLVSFGGLWLIRLAMSPGHPVTGVARTIIDQASRTYIIPIVIALLALLTVMLPLFVDAAERPDYRVHFYLTWSMAIMAFVLGLMTILLACWSVSYDLTQRQIFMIAAKPVGRFQYLCGKWAGLCLLNLVLVVITGIGVWVGANYLADMPLASTAPPEFEQHRLRIRTDVLTARVLAKPHPVEQGMLAQWVRDEYAEFRREFRSDLPANIEELDEQDRAALVKDLQGKALSRWHTIKPDEKQAFVFDGLGEYRQLYDDQLTAHAQRIQTMEDGILALIAQDKADAARFAIRWLYMTRVLEVRTPPETFALIVPQYPTRRRNATNALMDAVRREDAPAHDAEAFIQDRREKVRSRLDEMLEALPPQSALRLRLRPKQPREADDGRVRLRLVVNGVGIFLPPIPEDTPYEHAISPFLIDDQGRLTVEVYNQYITRAPNDDAYWLGNQDKLPQMYGNVIQTLVDKNDWYRRVYVEGMAHKENISFEPNEGIVLLYTHGGFEGNLARAMIVHWVRLAFLAMMAIMCAAAVGLPIACLASLLIFGSAMVSGYARESLHFYAQIDSKRGTEWSVITDVLSGIWENLTTGEFGELVKLILRLIGEVWLFIVPSFSYYNPNSMIGEGHHVPWGLVGESLIWIGLVSTGFCTVAAWMIFRRKELAKVIL